MMKYKVGDRVKFVKECAALVTGYVIPVNSVWEVKSDLDEYYRIERADKQVVAMIESKVADDSCEKINTAPSITKRINDKHNILNSGRRADGEKLIKKLEGNQVFVMNDRPQRPTVPASTPEDKTIDSYYERAAMQPLEVMQRIMTKEQFKGFLLGNCIKYRMRSDYKGQHDSDEYKARQYAYWLELVDMGQTINPTDDKVPDSYKFKVV